MITTIAANQLEIANLDGNPGLDLLILDDSASSLQLFRNDGNGGFVGDPMFSTSQALANNLTVGDVDGALGLDIVVTHDGGEIVVMLGDGVGGFGVGKGRR